MRKRCQILKFFVFNRFLRAKLTYDKLYIKGIKVYVYTHKVTTIKIISTTINSKKFSLYLFLFIWIRGSKESRLEATAINHPEDR